MDQKLLDPDNPWTIGQTVRIVAGPFAGMEGAIYLIDRKNAIVRVKISFIGRLTPVELPFASIKVMTKDK